MAVVKICANDLVNVIGCREIGRAGEARHINIITVVQHDALTFIKIGAAQISGENQRRAVGGDFGHECVAIEINRVFASQLILDGIFSWEIGRIAIAGHIRVIR